MQDDPEFKPINHDPPDVRPDLELISGTPDIVFKCVSCGQEVLASPTDVDLMQGGGDRLEVAYELARREHTCPARPHPELEEGSRVGVTVEAIDLPINPEPFEHKEVGTPIRHILTTSDMDAVITDPNVVGLSPFFEDVTEAKATAAPYRARVWRLEEV